ncbi:MAG: exodeoxyribonuclease III [Tetrasphaera sp.]|nr:exodeoxyribonuclease III [Tetrasphaera sp.]
MRIASWNVNSIRSRIDRLEAWLQRSEVDVLAIQETKCKDAQFPYDRIRALGYEVAHHGLNQWNGVAILSRVGLAEVEVGFPQAPTWGEPPMAEARAIGATVGTGTNAIRFWSVYVPNGRHLTDPHMDYKVAWLDALRFNAGSWAANQGRVMLCGDWNIAPGDEDVWSMEFYADKSHVSPRERAAFQGFLDDGFIDVVRPHTPGPGVYTYWDYKQLRFAKRQGMRIDFLLCSPALAGHVLGAAIDREERKGTGASDHAPVVIELEEA